MFGQRMACYPEAFAREITVYCCTSVSITNDSQLISIFPNKESSDTTDSMNGQMSGVVVCMLYAMGSGFRAKRPEE